MASDCNSGAMSPDPHDEVVRRSFDRQVGLFSGPDSPFARRPEGALAWLEPLADDMLVLDVACGAGHAAETVAPEVREVVGIDLTATLLELGAARLRDAGITNVLLQEGNAEALPFVAESFDLVFCRSALHHMADPRPGRRRDGAHVPPGRSGRALRPARALGRGTRRLRPSPPADRPVARPRLPRGGARRRCCPTRSPSPTATPPSDGCRSTSPSPSSPTSTPCSRAFRAELDGGERTGFDPQFEDGKFVVSFRSCVVHGTRE